MQGCSGIQADVYKLAFLTTSNPGCWLGGSAIDRRRSSLYRREAYFCYREGALSCNGIHVGVQVCAWYFPVLSHASSRCRSLQGSAKSGWILVWFNKYMKREKKLQTGNRGSWKPLYFPQINSRCFFCATRDAKAAPTAQSACDTR